MSTPDYKGQLTTVKDGLIDVVEKKVVASTTTATLTSVVVAVVGLYVMHGTVPDWAITAIGTAVTGLATWVAGYFAKHTSRTVRPPEPAGPATPPDTLGRI